MRIFGLRFGLLVATFQLFSYQLISIFLKLILQENFLSLDDGGTIALDWEADHEFELVPETPIIVILHGLTGGSHENYVRNFVQQCTTHKWRVVVFNARGCSNTHLTTPKGYSASNTDDIRTVLKNIHSKYPKALLFAVGYSLGANILTKYVGEAKNNTLLTAAIAYGNPWDLVQVDAHLSRPLYKIVYNYTLGRNLVDWMKNHVKIFEQRKDIDISKVLMSKYVREFDDRLVRRVYNFSSVDEYYDKASSSHVVGDISIPFLALNSFDDPICTKTAVPFQKCEYNKNIMLVCTRHGGHLAWNQGLNGFAPAWSDLLGAQFIKAVISYSQIRLK